MKENHKKLSSSTMISIRYASIALIITMALMVIIPKVLNYGPEMINTDFDIQMSKISFKAQFSIIAVAIISLIVIVIKILLKDIDKYITELENSEEIDKNFIIEVRKKCLNLPYLFLFFEAFLPSIVAIIVLSVTGSHSFVMIGKILFLLFSFSLLLSIVSFIFSKSLFDEILSKTFEIDADLGPRIILKNKLNILIFPVVISTALILSLVGYMSSVIEKEDAFFELYTSQLEEAFDSDTVYTEDEAIELLKSIKLHDNNEAVFLIKSNDEVVDITDNKVDSFIIEYLKQIASRYDGRLYGSYGNDIQGSSKQIKTDNGFCYVGITYEVIGPKAMTYLLITGMVTIILSYIIIRTYGKSLSRSLHTVYAGFKNIINDSDRSTTLPAVSNDEIGDLVLAFNDIQKMNSEHIEDIQDKQNMLIEKERLASLGQMIGGVAHSLKTPIFSVSGGIEGLNDLVDEFDSSIDDPTVNSKDMHEIAGDMKEWLRKMRGQLAYMSEVITTVKGQAVNLSGDDNVEYTIGELFSHTAILMKHELQNSLVKLNVENTVPDTVIMKGNINSLIQVLNNLISNAIQAYTDEPKKVIDLRSRVEADRIVICVRDYGPGLPDEVKDKLFKEMITTKGKEGTGLGVFMSYSMIKGKFNGDIKFITDKGKGTQFEIYLPI